MTTLTIRDTSTDTTTTLFRILHYIPNQTVAGIAGGIYVVIAIITLAHLIKWRAWWGLCLPIGALVMAEGLILRIACVHSPNSLGLYIVQSLSTVLSPAAFLAFNYITFGRLVRKCVGPEHSMINPKKVGTLFVISDVVTFLIQSGGGGLQASSSSAKLGSTIFTVGLVLQTISYLVFCFFLCRMHLSAKKSARFTGDEAWWKMIPVLYLSSGFILVRCVYRLVEGAEGYSGFLATHETYFYVFDTLPLALAIAIYTVFWPSRYLQGNALEGSNMYGMHRAESKEPKA